MVRDMIFKLWNCQKYKSRKGLKCKDFIDFRLKSLDNTL